MSEEKIPELEIEQSEIEPIDLPEGRRRAETGDQQDFGKDPKTGKEAGGEAPAEDDGSHPDSGKDSGKFPRATKRRKHKEEMAERKKQAQHHHKMMQEMRKPVRHGEMFQIYQQIRQFMITPVQQKLQAEVDKLMLIPDFIGNCLNDEGRFDIEPSLETFEEFHENYMKKLEEELAREEQEAKEAAAKAAAETKGKEEDKDCLCGEEGCFRCTPDPNDTPETEETQTE